MNKHSSPALTMRDALYEAPGPKMLAKIRIGTAISLVTVAVLVALVLQRFYVTGQLSVHYWYFFTHLTTWKFLLAGFEGTVKVALTAGVIALVIAAARFLPRPDADMTRQFQKSAALLLKSLGGLDLSSKPKIRFTDEAMQIKTNQKSADFPYEKMETLVETPSLFLLTHSGSATVLQKKDLILGTPEEFLDFFRAHAACPCAKLTEE